MAPQTETKTGTGFKAGVKEYRLTYYTPDYKPGVHDILAAFRITPQPGVPAEEAGACCSRIVYRYMDNCLDRWSDKLGSIQRALLRY
jgi:hypothetical protein